LAGVRVAFVCDKDPHKLSAIRQLYPGLPVTANYQDLLRDESVEAVVISTPATTHYDLAKAALKAGKHILVEKPLSTTVKDAQDLLRLSEKSAQVFMVGHTFLFNPAVARMKEVIASKELGSIYYIHCRRTNLGPIRKDVNAIWDLSPHDISIINYLLDSEPTQVYAAAARFLSHDWEDVGFIILEYPGSKLAHIHVSWLDPKKIREMTIIGRKKMLVYDDTSPLSPVQVYDKKVMKKRYEKPYHTFEEFQLIIRNGQVSAPKVAPQEPLQNECRHFIDCIRCGKKPNSGARVGLAVVKTLCAIDRSLAAGAKVRV
jgi:predicted dehydrogenase